MNISVGKKIICLALVLFVTVFMAPMLLVPANSLAATPDARQIEASVTTDKETNDVVPLYAHHHHHHHRHCQYARERCHDRCAHRHHYGHHRNYHNCMRHCMHEHNCGY